MDATDLETFIAVAEDSSFSRAAERLNLTQPAVTKRIQRLEENLGTRLFDRIGKRVELTEGGRLLLPRAEHLRAEMADTRRLLENLRAGVSGTLDLATSHHVGLHRLAPVLKTFSDRYPEVRLDIRFEDSEAAHDLVRRGDSELAVVTLDPKGPADLAYQTLWDDPLTFMVARRSSAGRESLDQPRSAGRLSGHPAGHGDLHRTDRRRAVRRPEPGNQRRPSPPTTWKPSACSPAPVSAGACCPAPC